MQNTAAPLSPHLQIYHWYFTMFLSIVHRATGAALAAGALLLACWLMSAAQGEETFRRFHDMAGSWIGQVMLAGWLYSFVFHFLNGLRHLVWDAGGWLTKKSALYSGYAVFALSVLLTGLIWCMTG